MTKPPMPRHIATNLVDLAVLAIMNDPKMHREMSLAKFLTSASWRKLGLLCETNFFELQDGYEYNLRRIRGMVEYEAHMQVMDNLNKVVQPNFHKLRREEKERFCKEFPVNTQTTTKTTQPKDIPMELSAPSTKKQFVFGVDISELQELSLMNMVTKAQEEIHKLQPFLASKKIAKRVESMENSIAILIKQLDK